jgi:DNA-binding CsgD family transcriptional regulator
MGGPQTPIPAEEVAALVALLADAGRGADLSERLQSLYARGLAEGAASAGRPSVLIDRRGRVVYATECATRLFDHEFKVKAGRLWARHPKANAGLLRLAAAARDAAGHTADETIVWRSGRRPIVIVPVSMSASPDEPGRGPRLLACLIDLDGGPAADPELLCGVFDLTPAEARVAAEVLSGASTTRIAETLGLKESSLRQQIKSILAKSGTHSRSEFTALAGRLFLGSAGAARQGRSA